MNIDTDALLAMARAAKSQTGEDYFSIRFAIHLHKDTEQVSWQAYTPLIGHSAEATHPETAIMEMTSKPVAPEKLIEEATQLEAKAAKLRHRAGGAK